MKETFYANFVVSEDGKVSLSREEVVYDRGQGDGNLLMIHDNEKDANYHAFSEADNSKKTIVCRKVTIEYDDSDVRKDEDVCRKCKPIFISHTWGWR